MASMKMSGCMKLVSRMSQADQDLLLARLDQYQADGVPAERAQFMAAQDTLAEVQGERTQLASLLREQHPDLFVVTGGAKLSRTRAPESKEFKRWFGESVVVDEQGQPLVVYHGTQNEFDEFSLNYRREDQGNDQFGPGYYSTTSATGAGGYAYGEGANIKPLYVRIENPIDLDTPAFGRSVVERLLRASPDFDDALMNFGDVNYEGERKVLRGALDGFEGFDSALQQLRVIQGDFWSGNQEGFLKAAKEITGHDGVVVDNGGAGKFFVAWTPNQLKSATGNSGEYSLDDNRITKSSSRTDTPEFKAWFGDSAIVNADGTPKIMYHGTTADISVFKPGTANAIFVANNPDEAHHFSHIKARDSDGTGKNILPVYVNVKNPFDYENPAHMQALREYEKANRYTDRSISGALGSIGVGSWEEIERKVVQDALKKLGFDAFYVKEGIAKNLGVYDPANLKSATGNNGNFDATNPNITKSTSRAPEWVPQNIWDLHEKLQRAEDEANGRADTGGKAPGALKRNETMAFRRLNKAAEDYFGGDAQKAEDLMVRMNQESNRRADEDDIRFSRERTDTPAFREWFGDSVVVNADGTPKVVYRGEHGESDEQFQSRRGALSFGTKEIANLYAERPNDHGDRTARPRVTPAYLRIENPLINTPDDPFIELSDVIDKLGQGVAEKAAREFYNDIYESGAWYDDYQDKYDSINDLIAKNPDGLRGLYVYAYKFFDNPEFVAAAKKAGYDGAVHAEYGAHSEEEEGAEYKVFDESQVKSAIGNNGAYSRETGDITKSVTRTPEFKRWFGDSKVVDAEGKPLVVYHATDADFDTFDMSYDARGNNLAFFSDSRTSARAIIENWGGSASRVIKAYLSIQKPFDTTTGTMDSRIESWIRNNAADVERDVRYYDSEFGLSMFQAYFSDRFDVDAYIDSVKSGDWQAVEAAPSLVDELRKQGYDGIKMFEDGGTTYAIFRANQAKYTTNKAPTAKDDMRFSKQRIVGESKRSYTPEQLAMFKNTGRTVEVPTIKERIASLRKDLGKKLAQGLADQFRPLKDLSKEAYALARLSKGSAGAFDAFLHHGKLKITDNVYDGDTSGGFIERLGVPLHGELEDFMWWVAANRAQRLKAEGRENLFSDADIAAGKSLDQGVADYDYTLQHGPAKGTTTRDRTKIYRDAQITFNEFHKNALDMAEQSGLIDAESRKTWENEFYVPFYRVSEEDGGFIGAKIGQSLVRQRAFKMLKGGTDKLNSDLLANTLQNWGHLIDAAAKNRAAVASLEAAQKVGVAVEADQETVRQMGKAMGMRKNVVWAMDQGKERYFLVEDPYVLAAINSLEFAGLRGPLMDTLSTFKHWLTIGVTASPAFKIRNLVRDSLQAVATAPLSYNVAGNLAEGFRATKRDSQDYVSMLASGALIRFGTMEGTKADNTRRLIQSGVDKSTILDSEEKVEALYRKLKAGVDAYQEIGNRGEEVNRAALYKQLIKQGKSHQEASLMARDLMDFSMQGTFTTIRFLTQVVPFMNARIQGLYKLGKSAQEDPRRFGMVLGATALASIALMAAYADDDDWKKREDWDRNNNWWFKFGGVAFRIPKPFEIGAIATMAERGLEYFTSKEMTGKRLGQNYWHIIMDNLSMNPVPQLAKPIIDVYSNKDSFSGRPIETMGMEKLKSQYRYTQNTSMVARGLSTATFGALSPVQFDHVMRGYFGWLGSFVVSGADYAIRPLTNEATRPQGDYWKMATAGIVSETGGASSRYVSQMYDQAKVLEEAYGTYRSLLKEGKTAEAKEFFQANKEDLTKYRSVERVKQAEAKFNERIRMIERSAMDPAVKKEKIREIQVQKDRVARLVAPGLR